MTPRCVTLAALLAASCTCSLSHVPPEDGSVRDATVDPPADCLPPGSMNLLAIPRGLDTTCGSEQLRECAVANARLADGFGEAVTICLPGLPGCHRGDACEEDPFNLCWCGGEGCSGPNRVCVRSAPGARPHCEEVCVREGPVPRACAGEPGPVPPADAQFSHSTDDCDDEVLRRQCRLWAQLFAPQGWAHASCATTSGFGHYCGMGDTCVPGESPYRPVCDCAGAVCALDEVCVSDTPDGVPRCEPACLPPI